MMQRNEEEFEIMYFSAQSPRDGSTIFERKVQMTKTQRKELDDKVEEYSTEFKRIFDTLCPQFDVRLSVIGGWLKGENKPIPEKEEFLNWFISEKIGGFSFEFEDYKDSESGQIVEKITILVNDFTRCFIPNLIDDYLLEYCKQYADKLEKKYLQLSTPAPEDKDEKKYPNPVIMMVAIIINGIEGESFLPEEANYEKRVELTIDAIYDKLKIRVGVGIGNNFNPENKLTKDHREKVVELLNSLGFKKQARAFKYKVDNR